MASYWLAETLKHFYLIFNEPELICNLNQERLDISKATISAGALPRVKVYPVT